MELKKILKLMAEKYPDVGTNYTALLIYNDGTGRLTTHTLQPYDNPFLFSFMEIDELIQHLQEK